MLSPPNFTFKGLGCDILNSFYQKQESQSSITFFYLFERCAQAIKNKEAWTGYLSLGFVFSIVFFFVFFVMFVSFVSCLLFVFMFFIFACIFLCTDHTYFLL